MTETTTQNDTRTAKNTDNITESSQNTLNIEFLKMTETTTQNDTRTAKNTENITESSQNTLNIEFHFLGGLNQLMKDEKKITVEEVPAMYEENPTNMGYLIQWTAENLVDQSTGNASLFTTDGKNLKPGIIVLIGDSDWELMNETEYVLENNDKITFISTLHGG